MRYNVLYSAPNHVLPCGNICPHIPNVISYNLYFTHRHQNSYSCVSVIHVTMVAMHNMLQD